MKKRKMTKKTKRKISRSLKKYYKNNPEARERSRRQAIKNFARAKRYKGGWAKYKPLQMEETNASYDKTSNIWHRINRFQEEHPDVWASFGSDYIITSFSMLGAYFDGEELEDALDALEESLLNEFASKFSDDAKGW